MTITPESLFKRLIGGNSEDVISKNSAEAFKLIVEKIATSPKLGKKEARSASILYLNKHYRPFIEVYLGLKNFENGEATKDFLSALKDIAKAIGGLQKEKTGLSILGLGRKE